MTIQVGELMNACQVIASQDNLDVCITESTKGALIAGAGAFICGVLMGPVGLAVGGTIGGIAGSTMCKSFKPLTTILSNMSPQDQAKFTNHMLRVMQELDITDGILLMSIATNPTSAARETIARELLAYFGTAINPANPIQN